MRTRLTCSERRTTLAVKLKERLARVRFPLLGPTVSFGRLCGLNGKQLGGRHVEGI